MLPIAVFCEYIRRGCLLRSHPSHVSRTIGRQWSTKELGDGFKHALEL
jgi:hypothetical protein